VGGSLTCNNLCCANFMCSIFYSMGAPYKWVWGAPGSAEVEKELGATVAAARALQALHGAGIAVVGSARVPGFYGSDCDEAALKARYGVHVEMVPLTDLYRRIQTTPPQQERAALQRLAGLKAKCDASPDALKLSARTYAALKQIAKETGAAGLAVRCWPELRDDLGVDVCLPMGVLGDDGIPCSCEADVPGALTMLMQFELTGRRFGPPALLDMVSIDAKNNSVGLWHCGVCSPSLAQPGSLCFCEHSIAKEWDPKTVTGLVLDLAMKPGPATLCRLQGTDASRFLAVDGEIIKKAPDFRGSYAEFRPRGMSAADLANTVMVQGMTHHYSVAFSQHAGLIREAAYWLGIEEIDAVPADSPGARFGKI